MINKQRSAMKILLLSLAFLGTVLNAANLRLEWLDNSDNEDGFNVERKTGTAADAEFILISQTAADVVTYTDKAVEPGVVYTYRVAAFNQYGSSGYSNEATGQTAAHDPGEATPPPPVGGPPATPSLQVQVTITVNGETVVLEQP